MRQPSLIETGSGLPSPMFKPRPGWGGKLRTWLHDNLYILMFRGLLLVAVGLVGLSLIRSWNAAPLAQSPSPSGSSNLAQYEFIAAHGVGLTHLAAKALDAYLIEQSSTLDAPRHLFAVDALARQAGWHRLSVGEKIVFDITALAQAVTSAQSLTKTQYSAWQRLLR